MISFGRSVCGRCHFVLHLLYLLLGNHDRLKFLIETDLKNFILHHEQLLSFAEFLDDLALLLSLHSQNFILLFILLTMSALSIIIRLSPSELVILLFELHHELKLLSLSLSAVLKGVLALIDLSF